MYVTSPLSSSVFFLRLAFPILSVNTSYTLHLLLVDFGYHAINRVLARLRVAVRQRVLVAIQVLVGGQACCRPTRSCSRERVRSSAKGCQCTRCKTQSGLLLPVVADEVGLGGSDALAVLLEGFIIGA